jgi:hypothetical protein
MSLLATAKPFLDMGKGKTLGWKRGSNSRFSTYTIHIIGARRWAQCSVWSRMAVASVPRIAERRV